MKAKSMVHHPRPGWQALLVGLLGLALLGAGSTLPLDGPDGPLSPAQSRAVLVTLRGSGPAAEFFDRHLPFEDAVVTSPLTTGNQVQLLTDETQGLTAMLAAIAAAREHVNIETHVFDDDAAGRQLAQALLARRRAGVTVNLIRDAAGTAGTPPAFFQRLVAAGVQVLEFHPAAPGSAVTTGARIQRDHRRLMVIDGRIAFLGGADAGTGSVRATQDGATPHDTNLQLRGPIVAKLQALFIATWKERGGPPLAALDYFPPGVEAGHQLVRVVASSPGEAYSLIYAALLSAIGSAKTSVRLTHAGSEPDAQLLAVLEAAARRGVAVTLIGPGPADTGARQRARRGHYLQLLEAGVRIHERHGAMLGSKTALVDGVWATLGSTNLDWSPFAANQELNLIVPGAEFGAEMQALFDHDLAASDAVTLAQWRQRGLATRLHEFFTDLWAGWH